MTDFAARDLRRREVAHRAFQIFRRDRQQIAVAGKRRQPFFDFHIHRTWKVPEVENRTHVRALAQHLQRADDPAIADECNAQLRLAA